METSVYSAKNDDTIKNNNSHVVESNVNPIFMFFCELRHVKFVSLLRQYENLAFPEAVVRRCSPK